MIEIKPLTFPNLTAAKAPFRGLGVNKVDKDLTVLHSKRFRNNSTSHPFATLIITECLFKTPISYYRGTKLAKKIG
jgi:hypothetical protein